MNIIYCTDCGREINTLSHAYDTEPTLCINCRAEHTNPDVTNMSAHPRCPECGCSAWSISYAYDNMYVCGYTCGHHTFGYTYGGSKLEHCPMCSDSGFLQGDVPCPYCEGKWS